MEYSPCFICVILLALSLGNLYSAAMSCDQTKSHVCPPGTFYDYTNCSGCVKCPDGSYSDQPHAHNFCMKCRICTGVFIYKTPCSPTQNAVCDCVAGFRCRGQKCTSCMRNCEAGEEPGENGCKSCPPGTFSNQMNIQCVPWSNCAAQELVVLKNGTSTNDVVCGSSPTKVPEGGVPYNPDGDMMMHIVLIILSVLFVMCAVGFTLHLMVWRKKKVINILKPVPNLQLVQTAQQEDSCSCGFPEEEEGEAATSTTYRAALLA